MRVCETAKRFEGIPNTENVHILTGWKKFPGRLNIFVIRIPIRFTTLQTVYQHTFIYRFTWSSQICHHLMMLGVGKKACVEAYVELYIKLMLVVFEIHWW